MKYIINLTIIFDPKGRELVLKNDSQLSLGLSKPATRLLNELVNNSNIDLSRDQLIKRVWEDYGFSPSNATLNNHISELRKAFEFRGQQGHYHHPAASWVQAASGNLSYCFNSI